MKSLVWIGAVVGSTVGGYVPTLWDADFFSFAGVLCSMVGGFVGIYIGWRLR